MKFVITRTSAYSFDLNNPPVLGAVLTDWERPGFGCAKAWMIEVSDLSDLLLLARHHGRLIITTESVLFPDLPQIEVYDDYRE